jgi:ribosomal protein S18 acetylase RimI-like enzyme
MISVRKCNSSDKKDILDICYKTGYMGEDLTGLGLFDDKLLFGYFFCLYYPRYESNNCFVAVDTSEDKTVGYILGACDTLKQRRMFLLKMGWRIFVRIILVTIWNYPETVKFILHLATNPGIESGSRQMYIDYPAHLHINILAEYQRKGIGEKLLNAFENNIRHCASGVHLITTDGNVKAIPFYHKNGYRIIEQCHFNMWRNTRNSMRIVFAKKLD